MQQNSPSSRQAEFSGKEMTWCFHCEKYNLTLHDHTDAVRCVYCGTILFQDKYVEDTTAVGGTHIERNLVRIQNACSKSQRRTLNEGCFVIYMLRQCYGITDVAVDYATEYYAIAVEHGFTRRRATDQVAAACLSVACREMKNPFLLIEFSRKVHVSVHALGTVYLQLCKFFSLQDHPFRLVDPSLSMPRCTSGLMKNDNLKKVLNTALHLAISMKKDWIKNGMEPGGTCAAAIYVSSLLHGYNLSKQRVANLNGLNALLRFLKVKAVHICEATLQKRLIEFKDTKAGSLRIQEFIREMQSCKQFASDFKMLRMTETVCQYKSGAAGFGLCKDCYMEFCGGLDGSQPPTFQCAEAETVHPENGNMKDTHASKDDETDTLSAFDDVFEIINCLVDEEESRLKEIIWGRMNPKHTERKHVKQRKQGDTRQVVARKKEKETRKRKLEAAMCPQFNKGLSSKINYDVLAHLFDDEEPNNKKNRDNDGGGDKGKEIANGKNGIICNDSRPPSWLDSHLELEYDLSQQLSKIPRFPPKRPPFRDRKQAPAKDAPKRPPCHVQNQAPSKNVLTTPSNAM